jgi:nicotinamide-nucleotide amidase
MHELAAQIGVLLRKHKLTLGTVESATGGLVSHLITNTPGSSDYYLGSLVSYSNKLKMKLAGVKKESLTKYGAVSPEVAEEMAAGGKKALEVDICLADTGIAGPGGAVPGKPVGLFYLGLAHRTGIAHRKHLFSGSRKENKNSAAEASLRWLNEYLLGLEK